jgi:hypothetical protein
MAKINTGTITADGSGNWTSNAIDMSPAGAKRVYMRVGGTEVLYRDFTATTGVSLLQSTDGFNYAADTTPAVAGPLTTSSSASILVACCMSEYGPGNGGWSPTVTTSGLTWTLQGSLWGSGTSTVMYTATPSTSTAYSVSSATGITGGVRYVALLELSGTTVGATAGVYHSAGGRMSCLITPQAVGSIIICGGNEENALATLPTGGTSGTIVQSDTSSEAYWVTVETSTGTSEITVGALPGDDATTKACLSVIEIKL